MQLTKQQIAECLIEFSREADSEQDFIWLCGILLDRWNKRPHLNMVKITKKVVEQVAKEHGITPSQLMEG